MNHPGEPHPLANPQNSLPILSVALPGRAPEFERDEHDIDLKGYFNILYLINGGDIGLAERIIWTAKTKAVWK
jgi:hypothetical protein